MKAAQFFISENMHHYYTGEDFEMPRDAEGTEINIFNLNV